MQENMQTFAEFGLSKLLQQGLDEVGFTVPTPIQQAAFSVILSGKDVVGIAQTGTGKTLAYVLPILEEYTFSKQIHPRVLILVPTRELVVQIAADIEKITQFMPVRTLGIYGGANINTQRKAIAEGADIIVATPGRLYDLVLSKDLQLKSVKKLVIDEVDVMLDLGFNRQLTNIFDLLPKSRQNIMFSATMTDYVDTMIDETFIAPEKIAIAVSGTPLENIEQSCYPVENFYTKVNLLESLLRNREFEKVLVFVAHKRAADRLFTALTTLFGDQIGIIHSNKTQNFRLQAIDSFDRGAHRVMIATDIMARGLDLDKITHVINFDTPIFPENYMHRIGRTGRADHKGESILFFTKKEEPFKIQIEELMKMEIPIIPFPSDVKISKELTPDERPPDPNLVNTGKSKKMVSKGFHEKSAKNSKTNVRVSHKAVMEKKYKKPKTRGDKNFGKKGKTR
jgi:ATP-dependent RNA helicase RhlE